MANELKNAVDQLKTLVDGITGIQATTLGQPLTALPRATQSNPEAFVYLRDGALIDDTYTGTRSEDVVEVQLYWLLTPTNVEIVEQNLATFVDRVASTIAGSPNLSTKVTIALMTGPDGAFRYTTGFTEIGGKLHRVLTVPVMITQYTHSLG